MRERIYNDAVSDRLMTPEEAALMIKDGMTVGCGGFSLIGYPKLVLKALAKRVSAGEKIGITLLTGASVGDEVDGELARAGAVLRRYTYQTNNDMRNLINERRVHFCDLHVSQVEYWIRQNYFGEIDVAVVEASAIDENGNIIPTGSVGIVNTLVQKAKKVIVEINTSIPEDIKLFLDIPDVKPVPYTEPIMIRKPLDRIGKPYVKCSPDKIAAIVMSDIRDSNRELADADETMSQIAVNLIDFLKKETEAGRLPSPLPPLQSGVGGVANAVLSGLLRSDFENMTVYSEVLQDSVFDLVESGKVKCASGCALTISPSKLDRFFGRIDFFKDRVVLRPQEISNSPEVIHRLGVIAMNTAIEVDLGGNVNSTHVNGTRLMNGLGGSGDYARNAGLSIFSTASTAKNGSVSCIVPFVRHVDHCEHDVQIIITEQGVADIRGLDPFERARLIIDNCAHPKFKEGLYRYLSEASKIPGHGIAMLTDWKG